MVQRPIPRGKAPRAAEQFAGTVVRPPGSAADDDSSVSSQRPQCQQIISQEELGRWDVLLLDRTVGSRKVYVVTKTDPQPKEANLHEYFEVVEGCITRSSTIGNSSKKRRTSHSSPPRNRRRIPRPKTPETEEDDDYVSDAEDELDGVLEGQEGEEYYSQAMRVDNLHEYFITALKMLGQLGCKDIGKAWIKMGHPKKQTTHPYNGGNTKQESLLRYGFAGALTRPDYWPPCEGWQDGKGCRHQEPDHIKKPERLILLNHLLHCGHPGFTLEKLEMGTAQIEREIPKNFTAKSIKILRQIYFARRVEIRYERAEIDGETVINLYMPKPPAKASKVPKAIIASPIKDEPLQQEMDSKRSAKAPTAAMGFDVPTKGRDLFAAQMDLDSMDDTELTVPESTPASTVSSVASECISLQPTQNPSQYIGNGVPKTESPSFVSDQRQWNRRSSFSQRDIPCLATTGQFGGLPVERIQNPSRKREPVACTRPSSSRPSSSKPTSKFGGQRASLPYQGETPSGFPSAETQFDTGMLGSSEHRQMKVAPSTRQQPRILPNTPAYPVNSRRPLAAPKPMSFSGSSSGFAGLPSENLLQTMSDLSNDQQFGMRGSVYTEGADPNALLTSYPSDVTSSFGSDYSDHSFGSGLQTSNSTGPLQSQIQANQQALDAEWRQQYPTYITSNFTALSVEPGPSDYTPLLPKDYTIGMESQFNPYGHEPRYP